MKTFGRFSLGVLGISLLLSGNVVAADKATPDGIVVIDQTQVMLLIGGSKGGGTLLLGDNSYSFKTGGVKVGGLGVHKTHLKGHVFNLNDVADFAGTYFSAEAGITVVKGMGGLWLKNDKGVTIHLKANADGLALSTGAEGLKITME